MNTARAPEPAAPDRWQSDEVRFLPLGPGVRASLRVTRTGHVRLTVTGGELDITAGAAGLGLAILAADQHAAAMRARREARRTRRRRR